MSISPGYTDNEIREIVYAYEQQPYGGKGAWLNDRGITPRQLQRWKRAVFNGDLDRGLAPRQSDGMPSSSQRRQTSASQDAKTRRIAELEARVNELEATNDALGKAIGLLHEITAHGPDDNREQRNPSDS
ncbi:hypothetical protein [Corynebacterium sp.]|jgi:hypothetical protein|uniref:hypothetical protein n=1 Tax=Corynebacterium sp. TaxID=1720 RepID=UPI0025BF0E36|nr:hypothetical protein [Corynebacterium sp.]